MQTGSSLIVLFLLFVVTGVGTTAQQPSPSSNKKTAPSVRLTERDNGNDVDLAPNTSLIVSLPGNPSTGYRWSVVGDPSPLKLQRSSFRKGASKGGTVGASGSEVFQLQAGTAGMATLTLVYRRSWEYNLPPMKTFSVRVNVR